jgi:hypothetical protein
MLLSKKWKTFRSVYSNERSIVIISVVFAILAAAFGTGIMAFHLWNTIITFIISLSILLGLLIICMPTNGMSNSLVTPTFLLFLGCCIIFITIASVIKWLH